MCLRQNVSGTEPSEGTLPTTSCAWLEQPDVHCLRVQDVLIVLVLILIILLTLVGNLLVILSVAIYRRMRTFTNFLLVSLSTADFLVGVAIMPLALTNQLNQHRWMFGKVVCVMWVSSDVFLCTASILSLCAVSLDRYFAITNPLKYARMRSPRLAAGLVLVVWLLSAFICSPPLWIDAWGFELGPHECGYTTTLSYRVYSSLGSFYIPLLVMLFVYYKIFRVANSREQALNIGRSNSLVVRIWRHSRSGKPPRSKAATNGNRGAERALENRPAFRTPQLSTMALAKCRTFGLASSQRSCYTLDGNDESFEEAGSSAFKRKIQTKNYLDASTEDLAAFRRFPRKINDIQQFTFDEVSMTDYYENWSNAAGKGSKKNCAAPKTFQNNPSKQVRIVAHAGTPPSTKMATPVAGTVCWASMGSGFKMHTKTGGTPEGISTSNKPMSRNREKIIYLKERKALKTIGAVVCGFVICWLPFFVLYVVEVICRCQWCSSSLESNFDKNTTKSGAYKNSTLNPTHGHVTDFYGRHGNSTGDRQNRDTSACYIPPTLSDVFLWLGYSNSVLNPFLYTFYNIDFRRCFKDLLTCGCWRRTVDRRMSVRRLHQSRF